MREVTANFTGIESISASGSFEIYLNPVSNMLNIVFSSAYTSQNSTLEIMDVTGRAIVNSKLSIVNSTASVDVSALSTGMYFIKVSGGKDSQVVKFIKE